MQSGLADPEPEVRRAAYETLLTWKDEREVGNFLAKGLEKDLRAKGGPATATPVLAVLLASDLPDTRRRMDKFLETSLAKSRDAVFVLGGVADELGLQGDRSSLAALRRLAGLKCVSETFACRRAVVQAMIRIRRPEGVAALIPLLPDLDGEVRGNVVRYLEEISGQRHGTDAKLWQAWWKEHADGFEFPAAPVMVQGPDAGRGARRSLLLRDFDLRPAADLRHRHVRQHDRPANPDRQARADLCDQGPAQRRQLGILVFNTQVTVWRPALIPATAAAKQEAASAELGAGGRTAAYDALDRLPFRSRGNLFPLGRRAHLRPDPCARRNPGRGPRGKPQPAHFDLLDRHRPRSRPGSRLELCMKTLADQNFGQFRQVDQYAQLPPQNRRRAALRPDSG